MMSNIEFSSEMTVKLVRAMASDDMVVQAAQVSAKGENKPETVPLRLIEALMKGRHGSPFEHNAFTFFVEAPLFVFREWQRHRVGSFNEMSGRYTKLLPKFYTLSPGRKVINKNTKMKPEFEYSEFLWNETSGVMADNAEDSWEVYEYLLRNGVANEVARMVLPLNIYSQMYWTVNARSLMNFLSLRIESEESLVKSYPQWEIQMGAEKVEEAFRHHMPATWHAWVANGRVAP